MPAQQRALAEKLSKENQPENPIVEHLQREVANAFILYANYKHYHWQTYGPLFRDLHLMFDEFAEAVLKTIDEMAERVRMIGQDPVYHPNRVQEVATVQVAGDHASMRERIEEADANLMLVIRDMREAARAADEENDPGTVDLFSKIVQIHEKHEWFLREVLRKRDGLTA